ncbi:hypothetical protein [Halomonas sp.]|uniref:hypothetical protein n=1 Tax=Halomonas sp. TaxID=1486246 RepID=UPI003D0E6E27
MNISVDVERLVELSQVSRSEVASLLELLRSPEDMTHLELVMSNLQKALRAVCDTPGIMHSLHEEATKGESHTGILAYQHVLDQILAVLADGRVAGSPDSWWSRTGRQRGIINEHPEWAMLILLPNNECHTSSVYWQHAGVVLACASLQRARHGDDVGSEITAACRVIRSVANGNQSIGLLKHIATDLVLTDYHAQHLLEAGEPRHGVEGIELLVRKVLIYRGKSREGGGGGVHASPPSTDTNVESRDDADPEPEGPEHSVQVMEIPGGLPAQRRQRTVGLHPVEMQTMRGVTFTERKESPTAGHNLADLYRCQKGYLHHISRNNQRLPYRYASLTRIELAIIAKQTYDLYAGINKFEGRDANGELAGVLLMLMLWLGRPIDQLLTIRIYPGRHALPKNRKDLLAYLLEEQAFVIPIPSPAARNALQDDAKQFLERAGEASPALTDDVVIICLPVRVGQFISQIQQRHKGRSRYAELFPVDRREAIQTAMSQAVSTINRAHRMRLTPLRISQTLFDEIVRHSSDWVDAYLLTGHAFTVTEVASHYYSVSATYLDSLFCRAVVALRDVLYQHLSIEETNALELFRSPWNSGDHGSKLNMRPRLVRRLVDHLKHELRAARRLPPSEESARQVHNHLVAYIAFWVLFATGYRAVNDLVFRWREIDLETGLLVISDKEHESMSQSRVVWLLPQLREQLRLYAWHLEVLQMQLYRRVTLYDHIESLLGDPCPDVPLLFFVSESWQMVKLSPENLRRQVPLFSLPINAGRHYLRSRLRAAGCRGELVNAFMGHAQHGQEPFAAFSTISPVSMFAELAPVMEKLRREAGWTPQRGMADV